MVCVYASARIYCDCRRFDTLVILNTSALQTLSYGRHDPEQYPGPYLEIWRRLRATNKMPLYVGRGGRERSGIKKLFFFVK